ncbi:hypothetical protein C474_15184 [Halogeometricum pallidum JCM 14848]|uniref:DUF7260 domain-containing protein n=1 Tax=Halogeometricum pallidum JCM 14848 TaxID=1227487 RepID=M0D0S0_HALPD|nr:hypothetical protein [Halogeometricum pallidum]ELZ28463.1 hypothetical protein C474_15184 [Halogeometricum pallidum JCM 14848]
MEGRSARTAAADIETHVDRATARVREERTALEEKSAAYESFVRRVAAVPTEPAPSGPPRATTAAGTKFRAETAGNDRCRAVREAFAETIRPHSVADMDAPESLSTTIRSELTDSVADVLATTTEAAFTPEAKRAVVAEARTQRAGVAVTDRALDREAASLDDAADVVEEVTAWVAEAERTPLSELGFDALRSRHRTLAAHRERCEEAVADRQAFLRESTGRSAAVEVDHRTLARYLYQELPVRYPALSTVARLDGVCESCQRAVRAHLVRRA